jgi:hypothetical protein
MRLRFGNTAIGPLAAVCLSAATASATTETFPSACEGKPPSRDGFASPIARRLTRLLHRAAAAVPRTAGDGLLVTFDSVPVSALRNACWVLPDQLTVYFERQLPTSRQEDQQRRAVSVTLWTSPLDNWADGEIIESTPDLLVVGGNPQGRSTMMIFGARRPRRVVERAGVRHQRAPSPERLEDGLPGPYIVSVSVSIVAAGRGAASTVSEIASRFDRATIMKLLRAEQERRRADRRRTTRD